MNRLCIRARSFLLVRLLSQKSEVNKLIEPTKLIQSTSQLIIASI
jgi:hypothetical protein